MDSENAIQKLIESIYEYKYLKYDNSISSHLKRIYLIHTKKREIKTRTLNFIRLCILNNKNNIEVPFPIKMIDIIDVIKRTAQKINNRYANNILELNSVEYRLLDSYENQAGVIINFTFKDYDTIYQKEYVKLYGFKPFNNNADPYTSTVRILYSTDKLNTCIIEANKAGYKLNQVKEQYKSLYPKFTCIFEKSE